MQTTGRALLRCLAIIALAVILVLAGLPAAIGWFVTMITMPVAEWAKDSLAHQVRNLRGQR